MNEPPSIRGTRLPATRELPPAKPYVYRNGERQTGAILTRAGTSSHGAWCEPCQDGIRNTTKRRAVDWLTRHNNRHHRQPQTNP